MVIQLCDYTKKPLKYTLYISNTWYINYVLIKLLHYQRNKAFPHLKKNAIDSRSLDAGMHVEFKY